MKFLSDLGLFGYKFNYSSGQFERCLPQRLKASLTLFLLTTFSLRLYISTLFKRGDPIQLKIGNLFNYFPDFARKFLGYAGLVEVGLCFRF